MVKSMTEERGKIELEIKRNMFLFAGNDIGEKGADSLGDCLRLNSSLTKLSVSGCEEEVGYWKTQCNANWTGNRLGDGGIKGICTGLRFNVGLITLDIGCGK